MKVSKRQGYNLTEKFEDDGFEGRNCADRLAVPTMTPRAELNWVCLAQFIAQIQVVQNPPGVPTERFIFERYFLPTKYSNET